jgi:hypothetical protein
MSVYSTCYILYKVSQHGRYDTCLTPLIVFLLSERKIAAKHQKDNIFRHNEDGSYTYGYEAADGTFKLETRFPDGSVQGRLLKGIVSQYFLCYFSSSKDTCLIVYTRMTNAKIFTPKTTYIKVDIFHIFKLARHIKLLSFVLFDSQ